MAPLPGAAAAPTDRTGVVMQQPTAADLAGFLGLAEDDRMVAAVAAACEFAQDRRSLTDSWKLWESPRVRQGVVLYAALLYQARATPSGFPGYDEFSAGGGLSGDAVWRAKELIGQDVVVA